MQAVEQVRQFIYDVIFIQVSWAQTANICYFWVVVHGLVQQLLVCMY